MANSINWGKIYDSTWWGDGVSNAISWGKSYVDLAGNLSSQLLSALKSRATNYENNAGSKAILDEILDAELLEKASIVVTPTAYDVGLLNCVKPEETLSTERIPNGQFDQGVDGLDNWGTQSDVTVSNGVCTLDSATQNAYINNFSAIDLNKVYKVSLFVNSLTVAGKMDLINTSGLESKILEVGQNDFYYKQTGGTGTFRLRVKDGAVGSVSNISVKEATNADFDFVRSSTATRVNASGQIESVASNVPRIDYSDGVGKILLEPQGTNVIPYSEDFSQWSAASGSSVESNYAVSPDGTQNADKLNFDGTFNGRVERFVNSGIVNGSEYTFSVWLKTLSGTVQAFIGHDAWGLKQITVTDQWQRFTHTVTSTTTYSYPRVRCNSASDILAWGYQLEQQSYMTSYIPTSSTAVTRSADVANNSGSSSLINSTEGVLYAEISALNDDLTERSISLTTGLANPDRVTLQYKNTSNKIQAIYRTGTVNTGVVEYVVSDMTDVHKIAFKYKANDFALWVDGVERATDTSGTTSDFGAEFLTFDRNNATTNPFYGKAKCVAVFKEALTDTELQNLTS